MPEQVQQFLNSVDASDLIRVSIELILLIVGTGIALRLVQPVVNRLVSGAFDRRHAAEGLDAELTAAEQAKRVRTIKALLGAILRVTILIVAFIIGLGIFSIDLGPAIAGLGLLSLGVGLGLQSLVKDVVAGTFIILENQYAQGDVVSIAGVTGTVEDLGLRRTVLRDTDGTVHVVPNGLIEVASNRTRVWANIAIDVPIKDPKLLDGARALVEQTAQEMAADPNWKSRFLSPPQLTGVKSMSAGGVVATLSATVVATDRASAASELRSRIVDAFVQRGIELGTL